MDSKKKFQLTQITNQKQLLSNEEADISLTSILNSESIQQILSKFDNFRERVFTPFKTIFTFVKQVLNPDKSCKRAVASVIAERLKAGDYKISNNTGPYCKARKRLPEELAHELVKEVARLATKKIPQKWKPYGRHLKVFDGSTAKASDTKENQETFPQHKNQKNGVGFPIVRFFVVMSLSIGTVINYAVSACKGKGTGETALLRSIFDCVEKKDIVLGDRLFPNFFLIANLKRIGADGIFHAPSNRRYDFRLGYRLGKYDHVVNWSKPYKPEWMNQEEYDSYPMEICVREFKVKGKTYVTTFLNKNKYHKKELAKIYDRRWEVEINLNSIKTIMNMDMLSCKTPNMVKKEIGIHFLAYNFIRIMMAEACAKFNAMPWQVSFKGSVQLVNEFAPYFLFSSALQNEIMYSELLRLIVKNKIGNRQGRIEPRALKKRHKDFPMLKQSRKIEKEKLMNKLKGINLRNVA